MTWEERENIFSKEVLVCEDIMKLFECDKQKAYEIIRKIRKNTADRIGEQGKIHVQDYIEYYKIPQENRYCGKMKLNRGGTLL